MRTPNIIYFKIVGFKIILIVILSAVFINSALYKSKKLYWPLRSGIITSDVGSRWNSLHTGIDIGVKIGTPVYASGFGIVTNVFYSKVFGNRIEIYHSDKHLTTSYSHLKETKAVIGDTVDNNTIIGFIGNTGKSTGPHLHFEIYHTISFLNPCDILPPHTYSYGNKYLALNKKYSF